MTRQKVSNYFLLIVIIICAGNSGANALYKADNQRFLSKNYLLPQPKSSPGPLGGVSFVKASDIARPCVVYIKVQSLQQRMPSFWDPFGTVGQVASSGSGVIISSDGYIVTNNHVIKNAMP